MFEPLRGPAVYLQDDAGEGSPQAAAQNSSRRRPGAGTSEGTGPLLSALRALPGVRAVSVLAGRGDPVQLVPLTPPGDGAPGLAGRCAGPLQSGTPAHDLLCGRVVPVSGLSGLEVSALEFGTPEAIRSAYPALERAGLTLPPACVLLGLRGEAGTALLILEGSLQMFTLEAWRRLYLLVGQAGPLLGGLNAGAAEDAPAPDRAVERLRQRNAELEARARALEAFAELNRDLSTETDTDVLVHRAQEVVLSLLPPGYAAYYEPDDAVWRLRAQTGDRRDPALQAAAEAGLPLETTRSLMQPWQSGQPHYLEEYDQEEDHLGAFAPRRGGLASVAIQVDGQPFGVFGVALFDQKRWSATDRAVLEMVARSLGLALEHRQSLNELAQRTRELERSNAELQQFAYVVSHDLQEPLRSITSFAGLLIGRALKDRPTDEQEAAARAEQLRTYGQYIRESGERMTDLLADLLAFSRVSAQTQPHRPVQTRLVLAQVEQDLRLQISDTGAKLHMGYLPWVLGDSTQLRQLFQNLIGNSLKFRHPDRPPEVSVTAHVQEAEVTLSVQDNGIGIEPEYFERIFVIFQRLHSRRRYPGSGIGLAIAQKVALRHGSGLRVSSVPGTGTTFTFTLPRAEPGTAPSSSD